MHRIRKAAVTLILLTALPALTFAAGYPVFDVENWVYSILEYTQMGQDTLNFVNEVKRQTELAEKLYKAINDGDLSNAFNSVLKMSTRLERDLNNYGVQTDIYSQLGEISRSSLEWGDHIDDPDYFLAVLDNLKTLEDQIENTTIQAHEDKKSDAREDSEEVGDSATSVTNKSESQVEIATKQLNEQIKANAQEPQKQLEEATATLTYTNLNNIKTLEMDATYSLLVAKNLVGEDKIESAIRNMTPDLGVDFTDPFEV